MSFFDFEKSKSVVFRVALGLNALAAALGLGILAYLGTFTRYLSDDYCDSVLVASGPILSALYYRYTTISDRYSNLLFDALSELVFPHHVQALPALMIVLWVAGLTWLVYEIRKM